MAKSLQQAESLRNIFKALPSIEVNEVYQNPAAKVFKKECKAAKLRSRGRENISDRSPSCLRDSEHAGKTVIFVTRFSANADEIKRRVLPLISLRSPVITDVLRNHSVTSLRHKHFIVNRRNARLLRFFMLIIVNPGVFVFIFLWSLRMVFLRLTVIFMLLA